MVHEIRMALIEASSTKAQMNRLGLPACKRPLSKPTRKIKPLDRGSLIQCPCWPRARNFVGNHPFFSSKFLPVIRLDMTFLPQRWKITENSAHVEYHRSAITDHYADNVANRSSCRNRTKIQVKWRNQHTTQSTMSGDGTIH